MSIELLLTLFSVLGVGLIGFAGTGDDPPKEDPPKEDPPKEDDIDAELKELLKDPKAAQEFLVSQREKKRNANAESKGLRLKVEKYEKEKADTEKKKLEDEGKFKELADNEKKEKEADRAKFTTLAKVSALELEAVKQGIVDPDDVSQINLEDVEIDDNFKVGNAETVIKAFKEKKPHKFKEGKEPDDKNKLTTPAPPNTPPAWKKNLTEPQSETLSADADIDKHFNDNKK